MTDTLRPSEPRATYQGIFALSIFLNLAGLFMPPEQKTLGHQAILMLNMIMSLATATYIPNPQESLYTKNNLHSVDIVIYTAVIITNLGFTVDSLYKGQYPNALITGFMTILYLADALRNSPLSQKSSTTPHS